MSSLQYPQLRFILVFVGEQTDYDLDIDLLRAPQGDLIKYRCGVRATEKAEKMRRCSANIGGPVVPSQRLFCW